MPLLPGTRSRTPQPEICLQPFPYLGQRIAFKKKSPFFSALRFEIKPNGISLFKAHFATACPGCDISALKVARPLDSRSGRNALLTSSLPPSIIAIFELFIQDLFIGFPFEFCKGKGRLFSRVSQYFLPLWTRPQRYRKPTSRWVNYQVAL